MSRYGDNIARKFIDHRDKECPVKPPNHPHEECAFGCHYGSDECAKTPCGRM